MSPGSESLQKSTPEGLDRVVLGARILQGEGTEDGDGGTVAVLGSYSLDRSRILRVPLLYAVVKEV